MLADNQKATLTKIIQTISTGAQMAHMECGEVSPMIFCFSQDPTIPGAAIPLSSGEEAKGFIANAKSVINHLASKSITADYYCLMSEAWTKQDDDLMAPSESLERIECISFSIFDKEGTPLGVAVIPVLARGKFAPIDFKFADAKNPMITSADLNHSGHTLH